MVSGGAVTGFVRDESVSSYTPKPAPCPHAFLPLKTLPHWFFHVLSRRFAPSLMAFVAESVSFFFLCKFLFLVCELIFFFGSVWVLRKLRKMSGSWESCFSFFLPLLLE